LYVYFKKYIKTEIFIAILIVLVAVDLYPINKRFTTNDNFVKKKDLSLAYMPTMADYQVLQSEIKNKPELQKIASDALVKYGKEHKRASDFEKVAAQIWAVTYNTNYRVFEKFGSPFQSARTSYFHKSIGGYHGAKLRRIQELYDYHIEKGNAKVLNMLNTRYLITQGEKGPQAVFNPDAMGNCWLVSNYNQVDNADEEIMSLNAFDPVKELVVDKRFSDQVKGFRAGADSLAHIKMTQYAPNGIQYDYQSKVEQLAVFSEMYYQPGWNAYVDGKLSPHFRANYVLRAMRLPAGKHKIEFKFEPKAFYVGEKISLVSMLLFFAMVLGALAWTLKMNRKAANNE